MVGAKEGLDLNNWKEEGGRVESDGSYGTLRFNSDSGEPSELYFRSNGGCKPV